MDKKELLNMAFSVNCSYELGIWSEIDSFLEYEEEVIENCDFKFVEEDRAYCLTLKLKNSNKDLRDEYFKKFVRFIEYSHATFYVKEELNSVISYYLLSVTKDKKGFLINVIFTI